MNCLKCKTVETKEDPLTVCDKCKSKLCQTCAKLSTTEYRAAILKSARRLVYLCVDCQSVNILTQENTINEIRKDIKKLSDKLEEVMNTFFQKEYITEKEINDKFTKPFMKHLNTLNSELQLIKQEVAKKQDIQEKVVKLLQNDIKSAKTTLQDDIQHTKIELTNMKESNKDMIKLLTERTAEQFQHTSSNRTMRPSSTSRTPHRQEVPEHKGKQNYSNTHHNNPEASEIVMNEEDTFTVVKRRPRKQKLLGSNVGERDSIGFEGRENTNPGKNKRLIWLFVSRAKEHVTEEMVKKYIHNKTKSDMVDIKVKLLKTFHKRSDNNCFLIGVDPRFKETVYEQTFWPNGVAFERFNFKRGQHFLDNPRQENTGLLNSSFNSVKSVFLNR